MGTPPSAKPWIIVWKLWWSGCKSATMSCQICHASQIYQENNEIVFFFSLVLRLRPLRKSSFALRIWRFVPENPMLERAPCLLELLGTNQATDQASVDLAVVHQNRMRRTANRTVANKQLYQTNETIQNETKPSVNKKGQQRSA